jgi:hypothetical protein
MSSRAYLSVCCIYRDEAPYLREWIEFHRLVGVERFFLYDNLSTDDHHEVLAPYIDDGVVTVRTWAEEKGPQRLAYDDCLRRHEQDSRWIAFLDADEFLFSPTGRPVAELLPEFEPWPAVCVHWAVYGPSGHREQPQGLVIEHYLRRTNGRKNRWVKNIIDPMRTAHSWTPHSFLFRAGFAVDENRRAIRGPRFGATDPVSFSKLRVNHYWTKSEEEFMRKRSRGWPIAHERDRRREAPRMLPQKTLDSLEEQFDDTITMYVPDLRRALAATAAKA